VLAEKMDISIFKIFMQVYDVVNVVLVS